MFVNDLRFCDICKQELPLTAFAKTGPRYRRVCRSCLAGDQARRRIKTPEKYLGRSFENLRRIRVKEGISWELTPENLYDLWAHQQGRCALSGLFMTTEPDAGPEGRFNATIDRIDPDGPYTTENVRLVAKRVNYMKGKQSDTELWWTIRTMLRYHDERHNE